MAHNKDRTRVAIGDVDWTKPQLNKLLQKVDDWSIDNRSQLSPHEVRIRIASGWESSATDNSALLVADVDGIWVLATRFPLPRGADVQVIGLPGAGPAARWAVVAEERGGSRIEDEGRDIYLSWLHPR